jgi:hypothetical protein
MNHTGICNEDELLAALQDPEPEVRRLAARDLGSLPTGDEGEVKALIEVMEYDDEDRVREMAYWALNSPANLDILHHHPKWEAWVNPVKPVGQTKAGWWGGGDVCARPGRPGRAVCGGDRPAGVYLSAVLAGNGPVFDDQSAVWDPDRNARLLFRQPAIELWLAV